MNTSLNRASASGDDKYLLLHEVYCSFTKGLLDKNEAVQILGKEYLNTVVMWER